MLLAVVVVLPVVVAVVLPVVVVVLLVEAVVVPGEVLREVPRLSL